MAGSFPCMLYMCNLTFFFFTLLYICQRLFLTGTIPEDILWAGSYVGPFARTRSILAGILDPGGTLLRVYKEVSSLRRARILSTVTDGAVVVLPPQNISWMTKHPINVLSFLKSQRQRFHLNYTIPDDITHVPLYTKLVHTVMKRRSYALASDVYDEIQQSCDKAWGLDNENWRHIPLYHNVLNDLVAASNRMFVGLPLCRDKGYLRTVLRYIEWTLPVAMAIKLLPSIARPILGWILKAPIRYYAHQFAQYTSPIINQHLASKDGAETDPDLTSHPPDTYITWYINEARKVVGDEMPASPGKINAIVFSSNFASVHNSAVIATYGIHSIASSDPKLEIVKTLREEVEHVLKSANGVWNEITLSKMYFLDSIVKEALRLHQIDALSMRRMVMTDLVTEDGQSLKKGTSIAVPSHGLHRDPEIYPNPEEFNPFRYMKPDYHGSQTEYGGSRQSPQLTHENARNSAVTSEIYLPFGHGRNACPGRWFAAMLLKMHIAHIFLNYDVKLTKQKPTRWLFGTILLPPIKAEILVKRRLKVPAY